MFDPTQLPQEFWIGIFFLFGLNLGSFANVVILRLPKGESVVHPRSRCGSCGKQIKWYHNLPVLSWFILRGKCSFCGAKYSFRYVVVELLTGLLFSLAYLKFGWTFQFFEVLLFLFPLVVVTFIDFDHFILPDVFTLSGIVIGLAGSFLSSERTVMDSALGVFFGGGFLWALAYFYFLFRKEEGLGGGDIKLLAWIGAVLGWKAIPFVILTSSVFGSIVGIIIAFRHNKGMKTMIPFGPYLAFGAVLYLFAGESLAQGYWSWLFPSVEP